ncbi:hypothetical protein QBC47DRAFT_94540 [Echria macrotheca]|uniref:Uncharacterized protein n=1 Tax=Echria macrotheca TaxID=438768 RepID=A0AAJ0B5X5_9PEZI|nr:hypothetical protein QBC47DRAFT_94540 [Echria macrotheca]
MAHYTTLWGCAAVISLMTTRLIVTSVRSRLAGGYRSESTVSRRERETLYIPNGHGGGLGHRVWYRWDGKTHVAPLDGSSKQDHEHQPDSAATFR